MENLLGVGNSKDGKTNKAGLLPFAADSHQGLPTRRQFLKSRTISRAAFAPEPPVKPAPGWLPEPHR